MLAPDARVARWSRQAIETGHPGFVLTPIVIALEDLPRITDKQLALSAPELAILSALGHPQREVARAALSSIVGLPEEVARLYFDVVMAALPKAARQLLEAEVIKDYEYQSEFARKFIALGRNEGREEGLRRAALELARSKLGDLAEEYEPRIDAIDDEPALTRLIVELGNARSAAEALGVLAALEAR